MTRRTVLPLLGLLLSAASASPAAAHSTLAGSSPAAGSTTPSPAAVVLSFSDEVLPELVVVAVTGPGGADGTRGAAKVDGAAVTQPLETSLTPGTWTVAYRVVSQDGHPVTDSLAFTVSPGGAAPSATLPRAAAAPEVRSTLEARSVEEGAGGLVVPAAVALAVGAVGAVGALALRRRRRSHVG